MSTSQANCSYCYGSGYRNETRTETDMTSSIVMGSALGTGYFPMTRTVTERVSCTYCRGTGKR